LRFQESDDRRMSEAALFPFDALAADYDAAFTESRIGTRMRRAVHRRLLARFPAGHRILELNCGTGEDAVFLARQGLEVVATDLSPAMVEKTRAKVRQTGLEGQVAVRKLAIEGLATIPEQGAFDGALSNFGGLNCVEDLGAVARGLARVLRPGAFAVLCLMGPLVPWEWLWYLGHGEPRKAFRRLWRGGVAWRGLTVRYPSIATVRHGFAADFHFRRVSAVGSFLPPSYAEDWAARHPALLDRLDRWERRTESWFPFPWLADHYLLELERR
jgi:SAM-dependent methyltransferase